MVWGSVLSVVPKPVSPVAFARFASSSAAAAFIVVLFPSPLCLRVPVA